MTSRADIVHRIRQRLHHLHPKVVQLDRLKHLSAEDKARAHPSAQTTRAQAANLISTVRIELARLEELLL